MVPDMAKRPAKNNALGQEVKVGLNTFPVASNLKAVYQYSVQIGSGNEKRGLIRKIWEIPHLPKILGLEGIIFDGNKLAWSMKKLAKPLSVEIDIDKETNQKPRKKPNTIRISISFAKELRFEQLEAYMAGKCGFDNTILESITFLDHLLRETPSRKFVAVKRCFFSTSETRKFNLGPAIEAMKGVYASMRIANIQHGGPARLTVNVDVANSAFFIPHTLALAAQHFSGCRDAQSFSQTFER